jgi:ketosteroid isomerase-like protein
MAEDNVDLVYRAFDAVNRRDIDAFLALMSPNIVFVPRLVAVEGGELRGHAGVRKWWASILDAFPDFEATVLEVRAANTFTIGRMRYRGRGGGSTAPFEETIWLVSNWQNGKSVWAKSFRDRAEALAAAGLAELPMADENVEAVRRVCAHWERGDWAGPDEVFDPNLEVVFATSSFPDPGTYRGGRTVLDAWRRWLEVWDDFSMTFEDLIDNGTLIVALNRLHGHGKESGVPVERDVGVIFEVDGGVIKHMVFCDRQEALEAAGVTA